MLEHSHGQPTPLSLFPSVGKVKWQLFIYEWNLEKGVSGRGGVCGTFGKALLSCRLTNKRVRSRNLSVTTAAD